MKQALYLLFCLCFILGCEKEPSPIQISISTGSVTDITPRSVFVQVSIDRHEMIREVGVLCSTDSLFNTGIISQSSTEEISGTTYKFQLSNLLAGTKYFYKAYASGKSGNIYGLIQSFTTEKAQLSISLDNIEASDRDSTYKIEVKSNMEWQTSSSRNWCEVSPKTGSQRDSINIKLEENTSTDPRQVIVTITAGNQSRKVTINQKGMDENLSVSSNYFSVSPENNSYSFLIQTNLSWTVTSNQPWCVPSSSSGEGENTLSFTVAANPLLKERSATITIRAESLIQEIKVIQQSKSDTLSVSTNTFNVNANKDTYSFSIISNRTWSVSSDQSWCVPAVMEGSNNQTVSFNVSENTSNQERLAVISVKAENLLQKITVTQMGVNHILAVSPDSLVLGPAIGRSEFYITSSTSWSISATGSSWCSVSATSGSNDKSISVSVTENTSTQRRTAIIDIKTNSSSVQLAVIQEGRKGVHPGLSVYPESLSMPASEQIASFRISSNTNWSISSDQTWCTPSVISGNGDKNVTLSVAKNTNTQNRSAYIKVEAGDLSQQIEVVQEGAIATLTVSPESLSATASSQTLNFDISSNTDWTISSDQAWCTPSVTSGNGDKNVSLSLAKNTNIEKRTAYIKIKAGDLSHQIEVVQEGAIATLTVSPESLSATASSQTLNFDISSNTDWTVSSDQSWCTPSMTSGNGDRGITCSLSANTQSQQRIAIMTVTAGNISKTIKVTQEGKEVSIINIPDANFKAYLVEYFDTDKDGEISEKEASFIKTINCIKMNVESLEGIEKMPNITFVSCYNNLLKSIDMSNNKKLEVLQCDDNNIENMNIGSNSELRILNCGNNELTELDVSNNKKLESLQCYSNQISVLNISNNTLLRYIACGTNNLNTLDVSQHPDLEFLSFFSNQITSIDVSNCLKLKLFNCGDNSLTSLDVSNNTQLTSLDCWQNKISFLDVSKNAELIWLSCWDNKITNLDLVNNIKIKQLQCRQLNKLTLSVKTGHLFETFNIGSSNYTTVIYK